MEFTNMRSVREIKTYQMAPMSPFNLPILFVCTSIVYGLFSNAALFCSYSAYRHDWSQSWSALRWAISYKDFFKLDSQQLLNIGQHKNAIHLPMSLWRWRLIPVDVITKKKKGTTIYFIARNYNAIVSVSIYYAITFILKTLFWNKKRWVTSAPLGVIVTILWWRDWRRVVRATLSSLPLPLLCLRISGGRFWLAFGCRHLFLHNDIVDKI